ncbi:MAG: hypothetical protein LBG62_00040 [Candidatus Methanoplasma sp.]|nr:hypothetical protein [Candidatus Methanoplasma sp.]
MSDLPRPHGGGGMTVDVIDMGDGEPSRILLTVDERGGALCSLAVVSEQGAILVRIGAGELADVAAACLDVLGVPDPVGAVESMLRGGGTSPC